MTYLTLALISALLGLVASSGEKASIDIVQQGNCPYGYLNRTHGLGFLNYSPRISFNGVNVTFLPKNPRVPGCFTVRVSGVNVLGLDSLPIKHRGKRTKELKDISAEYDLRIGGSPNKDRGARQMNCGKTKQSEDCPCESVDNSCMVCGFCKNLQRSGKDLLFNRGQKKYNVLEQDQKKSSDQCGCQQAFESDLYTLETEICTPEKDELMGDMTNDELEIIASEKKISMWATINIYDKLVGYSSRDIQYLKFLSQEYRNAFTAGLKKQKSQHLVGCFMLGYNVEFNDS